MYPETDRLKQVLMRLEHHLKSMHSGQSIVKDDLASVLHILHGKGEGYGLILRAANELGTQPPVVHGWKGPIPETIDGSNVMLGLRLEPDSTDSVMMGIGEFMQQACLRFAVNGLSPEATWSYQDVIKKVRNKWGSHASNKPPQWLDTLRFYQAADHDLLAALLQACGETTLSSTTQWLKNFRSVKAYSAPINSRTAIEFFEGYALKTTEGFDIRAKVQFSKQLKAPYLIFGIELDEPIIFGASQNHKLALMVGEKAEPLSNLEQRFRSIG